MGRRGVNPAPGPRRGGQRGVARARPPGFKSPASRSRSPTPLEARVQRGRGCGSGPAASRGSRAAAAAGTGAVRDRRRRGTGASRLRRRGERLRPPLTPSLPGGGPAQRPNPWFPWRRPEVASRREAPARHARTRALGASPASAVPSRTRVLAASLPEEDLGGAAQAEPGRRGCWRGCVLSARGASTHARPGGERTQRPEAAWGDFSQRWRPFY